MESLRYVCPKSLKSIALGLLCQLIFSHSAHSTVGIAEWEVKTPGGNLISHIDPLKERYGTCLRKADVTPGVVYERPDDVYVSHLEWWSYYKDHVIGKARRGYFIFNEKSRAVDLYQTEGSMLDQVNKSRFGSPLSKRLGPQDGWNEAWLPAFKERCKNINPQSPEMKGVSEAVKKKMKEICEQIKRK